MNVCSNKDIMIKIRPYQDFNIYQGSLNPQDRDTVQVSDGQSFKLISSIPYERLLLISKLRLSGRNRDKKFQDT